MKTLSFLMSFYNRRCKEDIVLYRSQGGFRFPHHTAHHQIKIYGPLPVTLPGSLPNRRAPLTSRGFHQFMANQDKLHVRGVLSIFTLAHVVYTVAPFVPHRIISYRSQTSTTSIPVVEVSGSLRPNETCILSQ